MHGLKIVRAQHENDERKRRIDFDPLLDTVEAISSRLERIVPDGSAAVQTILDNADSTSGAKELRFEYSRPSLRKCQSAARAGNDAPAQRVAVHQDLFHRVRFEPRIPPSTPRRICRPIWLPTVRAACLAIVSTMPWRRFVPHRNSSTFDGGVGAPPAPVAPVAPVAPPAPVAPVAPVAP